MSYVRRHFDNVKISIHFDRITPRYRGPWFLLDKHKGKYDTAQRLVDI